MMMIIKLMESDDDDDDQMWKMMKWCGDGKGKKQKLRFPFSIPKYSKVIIADFFT